MLVETYKMDEGRKELGLFLFTSGSRDYKKRGE